MAVLNITKTIKHKLISFVQRHFAVHEVIHNLKMTKHSWLLHFPDLKRHKIESKYLHEFDFRTRRD